jgi:beta-glucanase (GH16 family)
MLLGDEARKGPTPRRESRPPRLTLVAACSGGAAKNPDAAVSTAASAASASPAVRTAGPETATPGTTRGKAASAHSAAPPNSPAPAQGMALKFDATFEGSQLNPQAWSTCYPWATTGCTNFGNTEDPDVEWYEAPQDQVSDGILHLVAQREPTQGLNQKGGVKEYACRSGMVTTYPSLRFEYGYVQVTAEIPFGKGLWPAFWLAAANQDWPPEIDMLEHWGSEPSGTVYLHPLAGARQGGSVSTPNLSAGWHTFGLSWTKTRLTWYYDGTQVFTTSTGVPQQDMYFIANLADDDASPGGCSGSLLVKSVEVWQQPA